METKEDSYVQLAIEILAKSKRDLIAWGPSNYANTYQAPLGKGIIMITFDSDSPSYDPDGNQFPMLNLSFINARGETFHSLTAYDEKSTYYELLRNIYVQAHSSYMMIDDTFKSMMDDLRSR